MRRLDPQSLGQHVDALYRAAWALCGSREDAEDLVQETFSRVLARPRLLRDDQDRAYLMRVLRNTFYTSLRTASRRPKTAASLDDIQVSDPRSSVRPEEAVDVKEMFAAIAELPDDFRLALVAVDILGLSYREAGKALGVPEATIATRLFRARERFAQKWAPDLPKPAAEQRLGEEADQRPRKQEAPVAAHEPRAGREGPDPHASLL